MERWQHQLGLTEEFIGIGIDRIDYTKGIPERFRASIDSWKRTRTIGAN